MMKIKSSALLTVLQIRDFRLMMAAFSVSAAGSWAYNVGLMVYAWQQTHSPAWLGAVTIGRFIPSMLFGAYAGVIAERFERVRLMRNLDLLCCSLMTALTFMTLFKAPVALVIVVAAINSVLGVTYEPSVAATIPQMVPEQQLASANALRSVVDNVAVIAGPALGALMLLAGPPPVALGINAASFLWSAIVVSRISTRSEPVDVTEQGEAGPLHQMLVGVRTIMGSTSAFVLCSYSVLASFVYGVDTVLFVVLSERKFGTGPDGFGYLLAGLGVGGILGAPFVNRIAGFPRLGPPILLGMAFYCVPTIAFVWLDQPAVAFAVQVVRGAGTLVVDVLAITALQRSLPADKLARVFGAFFSFVLAAISLGALVTPIVLRHTTLEQSIWIAGLAVPLLSVLGFPVLLQMDRANVRQLAVLEPKILVLQRAAILAEASRPILERLAKEAVEVDVAPEQDIVSEGEVADAFYVIEDGDVRVHSHGMSTVEHELPPMHSGDFFGEIGLLRKVPRTATVTTVTPAKVLKVNGDAFLDAMTSGAASPSLLEGARMRISRTASYSAPIRDLEDVGG